MSYRARMALPGAALSLLLLAAANPHAARAASPHHTTVRKPVHHAARHTPRHHTAHTQAEANPAPIWSDASGTWRQTGTASWYGGKRWQGKATFSGTPYDEHDLTAAHATLPMGSKVRVVVADTGRSVVVTINDRPGTRRRIIDLSRAAAAKLGILSRGVATVTLLKD
jgi:rare lipoprotein A